MAEPEELDKSERLQRIQAKQAKVQSSNMKQFKHDKMKNPKSGVDYGDTPERGAEIGLSLKNVPRHEGKPTENGPGKERVNADGKWTRQDHG